MNLHTNEEETSQEYKVHKNNLFNSVDRKKVQKTEVKPRQTGRDHEKATQRFLRRHIIKIYTEG